MTLELDGDGFAKVPTVEELGRRGMARSHPNGKWEILEPGRVLLRDAMAHNAGLAVANPELARRRASAAYERRAR